jgi:hypothetical protein
MSHPSSPSTIPDRLLRRARDAADASDRWFVTLASEIHEVGVWARGEAQVLGESVGDAIHRTLAAARAVRRVGADAEGEEARSSSEELSVIRTSSLIGGSMNGSDLDLLAATHGDPLVAPAEDDTESTNGYAPGVLPVLQALERVIREHAGDAKDTLEKDTRFWKLIELLQLLRAPRHEAASQSEAGSAGEPAGRKR